MKKNETLSIQMDDDPREEKCSPTSVEGLQKVIIDGPNKVVQIGAKF